MRRPGRSGPSRRCDTGAMLRALGHLLITSLALWVASVVLPGMHLGDGGAPLSEQAITVLGVALILTAVNLLVRPVVKLLALPVTCATLGLFLLVINALTLLITSWVAARAGLVLAFDSFWWAIAGGIVVGLLTSIVEAMVDDEAPERA